MTDCPCIAAAPDQMQMRIKTLAETLSVDLIKVYIDENLCPYASDLLTGNLMAALAGRIYLMRIGHEASKKLEGVDILSLPSVRGELEDIFNHARQLTEEKLGARS